jgi:hypothetical protein
VAERAATPAAVADGGARKLQPQSGFIPAFAGPRTGRDFGVSQWR